MDKDLLTALEERWNAMAELIEQLRNGKAALDEELQGKNALCASKDEHIAAMEDELELLRLDNQELQQEKGRIIARIEGLLSKFSQLE